MVRKLKLMWLVVTCSIFAGTNAQGTPAPTQTPRLLIIGDYFSGFFSLDGKSQQTYTVLRAFLVNDSNDTLRYWGDNCHLSKFFSIKTNDYFQLVDDDCNSDEIKQIKIPPHRSQLIPLSLSTKKNPKRDVQLNVSMKFYSWAKPGNFEEDSRKQKPETLTDEITLRYDQSGNRYYTQSDAGNNEQKIKLNLPTMSLYLLTDQERKLYTVTVDSRKITTMTASDYPFTGEKVFQVPVTVHNTGDDTLKYYSMTCSWLDFYHTDNKYTRLLFTGCDSNIPTEVVVQPHSVHTDIVPVVIDKSAPAGTISFRVGLNVNKNNTKRSDFDTYRDELTRYNIIWSNDIQINK